MQTNIDNDSLRDPDVAAAESILRSCVHCGFCNATCPTYLTLGDERDGPRGRIYLIKQMLEGNAVTQTTQRHLDRCLTCLNCETTCPSGVEYGRLVDIGRGMLESRVPRAAGDRLKRWLLKLIVPNRRRFGLLLALAHAFRPALPAGLRAKIPARQRRSAWPEARHSRRMIALAGCAQAAATPNTNAAAARVLERIGIDLVESRDSRCCGALSYHVGDHAAGLRDARRNVDAWSAALDGGAEAIAITASGCGAFIKQYARLLGGDPDYAEKARRIAAHARDVSEILAAEDVSALPAPGQRLRIAFQCPCTLQHAQKLPNIVTRLLRECGFELAQTRDAHLCCGSAGAYSLLEPGLSTTLRDKKIAALTVEAPDVIATANVGCQLHLQSATDIPVLHWIELLDPERAGAEHYSQSN